MTDPEESAAKNEQELNLFSDQPNPGGTPAEPENEPYFLEPDDSAQEPPAEQETDVSVAFQGKDVSGGEAPPEPARGITDPDDSPVVAPPPPRKQPAPIRPGVVVAPARPAGRPSSSAPAKPERIHKPLPHALQAEQPIGQMLASIRAARGMSLEEVAAFTRIRMEYLVELESGELLRKLPPVYVSAYVRKLAEVYDLSKEDSEILLKKMRKETPLDPEELSETLLENVSGNTRENEGETKRIRYITILFYVAIGLVSIAVLWLVVLAIVHYAVPRKPVSERDPAAAVTATTVQPAEEPVSQTVHLDESELDALIVPETPSISVLKMSKAPGVRESL